MKNPPLQVFRLIENQVKNLNIPWVSKLSFQDKDPYKILISCILSLRTKDKTTSLASQRLFKLASNPYEMGRLPLSIIEKAIYPVGFYRNKAKVIKQISRKLVRDFKGEVPRDRELLLDFKGIGRKTANLVLGLGFGIACICVDTHVHRIANRIGWVRTSSPLETEKALEKVFPKNFWIKINTVLAAFGQKICLPLFPRCKECRIKNFCQRRNLKSS